MNNKDFCTAFFVNQPTDVVFNALINVQGWWSGEVRGTKDKIGGEFSYRWTDQHYSKQTII